MGRFAVVLFLLILFWGLGAPAKEPGPWVTHAKCSNLFEAINLPAEELAKKSWWSRFLIDVGLKSTPTMNPELARAHNENVLKLLEAATPETRPGREGGIDRREAQKIFDAIEDHKVVSFDHLKKYDPNGSFGFCFGRACAVYLEGMIHHDIDKNNIIKLFAIGNLKSEEGNWRYHVTTLIKAKGKEGWWAIDPLFDEPMSVRDWVKEMSESNADGKMMIFTTPGKRVSPGSGSDRDVSKRYADDTQYNGYFKDLFESMKKFTGQKKHKKKQ